MQLRERKRQTESLLWNLMLLFGIFIYGSHAVLLNVSKVDGKIPFNSMSVVFFIELSKLLISVVMLLPEIMYGRGMIRIPSPTQYIMFSVPAILYSINNNIVVHIQAYVDPASFQVLGNLKIVCIAVLYWIILQRPVSMHKWLAFAMITVAGACNSYGGWLSSHDIDHQPEQRIHVTTYGVILILLFCCISATAGVYTEYIFKKQAELSLPIQSIMLYSFGVAINFCGFLVSQLFALEDRDLDSSYFGHMFKGFSVWTIIIIFTQAVNGMIMGAIMRHASNLTRLVVIAGAMLVSTSLSVVIFKLQFNEYFSVAFLLIVVGMFIYHK